MPSGSNTLNVTGGNNQFVAVYRFGSSIGADAGAAAGAAAGGAIPFGGAGSLNNTNPAYDFATLDNGQVYTVTSGDDDLTIEGGNKQFVVEYLLPVDDAAGLGGNAVNIDGGNNKFVVAYDYSAISGGQPAGGNTVDVNGDNNQYVVSYDYGSSSGAGGAGAGGGANPFAGAGAGAPALGAPGAFGQDGQGNAGVTSGTSGDNAVTVDGSNNQYAIEYGNASGAGSMSGTMGGMTGGAMGGFPGGVGAGAPTAAPAGNAAADAGGMGAGGAMGGADLGNLLARSPFGRILDIPGVTPETLISAFASSTGGGAPPAGNPFAGAAPGSNPFSGLGANAGGMGGAPTGGGGAGGAAPGSSNPAYSYDFSSFGAGAAAPAVGGGGAAPSGAMGGAPGGGMAFGGGQQAGAGAPAAASGTEGGSTESRGPGYDLIEASPFGVLLDIPGIQPSNLGPLNPERVPAGGTPAGAGGGNPFGAGGAFSPEANSGGALPVGGTTGGATTNPSSGGMFAGSPLASLADLLGDDGVMEAFGMGGGVPPGFGGAPTITSMSVIADSDELTGIVGSDAVGEVNGDLPTFTGGSEEGISYIVEDSGEDVAVADDVVNEEFILGLVRESTFGDAFSSLGIDDLASFFDNISGANGDDARQDAVGVLIGAGPDEVVDIIASLGLEAGDVDAMMAESLFGQISDFFTGGIPDDGVGSTDGLDIGALVLEGTPMPVGSGLVGGDAVKMDTLYIS